MIIGFDISMLVYQGSGVAEYTWQLAKCLAGSDKKNSYKFLYSSLRRPAGFINLQEINQGNSKVYNFRLPPKLLKYIWNKKHILPVNLLIGNYDFFFSSDFLRPPLLQSAKGITTVHDLTWKIYPNFHTKDIVLAHERKMLKTIKYNDIIFADSENTKKDIYKYYPHIKNKVYVLYPGINTIFKKISDENKIDKAITKYGLNYQDKYILYVGAIEPRKNLDLCIKIFAEFIKDKKYSNYKFVIVGRAGWKNEKIYSLVKKLQLESSVIFTGYVKANDLPCFYNAAKLLLYLSSYEGFGLPPLEALACHCKVLVSSNSSLKEIIKDSDFLVSLKNKDIIYKKIKYLIKKSMSADKFIKYSNIYSWKKSASNFINIVDSFTLD